MPLNVNQFAQTTVQGQMDLQFNGSVVSAQVDAAQGTPLVAGQAVTMATTAGGVPKVLAAASNGDAIFGFVARNPKDASFPASQALEIALPTSVMYMTANGAIPRGSKVQIDYTTQKVGAWDGVTPTVGYAYDTAAVDGDLIRVFIEQASASGAAQRVATVTASLAEINAGKVLIPGAAGKKITVTGFIDRVTGAFATGTAVILQSTNVTPVAVATIAEAALTNGAVISPTSANVTLGAGFGVALGVGDGLKIVNSGSAQTGGTSQQFTITYTQA